MDFKSLNGVWKLKRFRITYMELVFKFFLGEFCFQIEFCLNLGFQMQKIHLKSFVFKIFLLEIKFNRLSI